MVAARSSAERRKGDASGPGPGRNGEAGMELATDGDWGLLEVFL